MLPTTHQVSSNTPQKRAPAYLLVIDRAMGQRRSIGHQERPKEQNREEVECWASTYLYKRRPYCPAMEFLFFYCCGWGYDNDKSRQQMRWPWRPLTGYCRPLQGRIDVAGELTAPKKHQRTPRDTKRHQCREVEWVSETRNPRR